MRTCKRLIAVALLTAATTACDGGARRATNAAQTETAAANQTSGQTPTDDGKIDCAIGREGGWSHICTVERSEGPDGPVLTLGHLDGGFRRFRIVKDGRGLVSADGAEQAKLSIIDDHRIEIMVGTDRYRLPATIASPSGQ